MNAPLIGARIQRKEDYRFLTGAGQYTDDVTLPGQTHAVFVRSPHAHAAIKSIKKDKALKAPGVLAVFTGEDLKVGETVTFDKVILTDDGAATKVGAPHISGAKVTAEVLEQGRSPKVTVIHYRQKSRYFKKAGHKQLFTKVKVTSVK